MLNQHLSDFVLTIKPGELVNPTATFSQIVQIITEAQEDNPKMFANHFPSFHQIINEHTSQISLVQKCELLQIVVFGCQNYPSAFKKKTERVKQIFNLIFQTMVSISFEVPPQWYQPPEGFNFDDKEKMTENDPDSLTITNCIAFIDRLASIFGYEKFIQTFKNDLFNLFQTNDWRYKAAVLMIVSQISEDISINKLQNFIGIIINSSANEHPKVRFATAHCIGQLADDLKPSFQEKYFDDLFPIITEGLNDSVERCASHWFACLTNFFEDFIDEGKIAPHLPFILEAVQRRIQNGSSHIKENAISSLASIGSISGLFNPKTIKKPMEICNIILSTYDSQGPYHQLINQTIECLTIFMSNQPKHLINEYFPYTIEITKELAEKLSPSYFFSAFHRICTIGNFVEGWEKLYEIVLNKTVAMINEQNSEIEDQSQGVKTILSIIQLVKSSFEPYAINCLQQFTSLLDKSNLPSELATEIVKLNSQILCEGKGANPNPEWNSQIKNCILNYVLKAEHFFGIQEFEIVQTLFEEICSLLTNNKSVYEDLQLQQLAEKFISFTNQVDNKKNYIKQEDEQYKMADEMDPQLIENYSSDSLHTLKQIKLLIPDIMREVLTSLKNQTIFKQLVQYMLKHSSEVLENESLDQSDYQYALYYLDNLVEDYEKQIQQYFPAIFQCLQKYSLHSSCLVRNAAVYGFGVMIEKYPLNLVNLELIQSWVSLIQQTYQIPQGKDRVKDFKHCMDNCVTVVGKILKRYRNMFDLNYLFSGWLGFLPLREDKVEGRKQIQVLIGFVEQNPEKIIKNANDLVRVLKVYAEFIAICVKKVSKSENQKVLKKLKDHIQKLIEWHLFKENMNYISEQLGQKSKQKIEQLVVNGSYV